MQVLNYFDNFFVSVYKYLNSNMYIMLSKNEAIIIDPHYYDDLDIFLKNNKIKKVFIILTHEHPDHISGTWWFLEKFECSIICSSQCASRIVDKKYTRPILISFILEEEDKKHGTNLLEEFKKDYIWTTYRADITYNDSFEYKWQGHIFDFIKAEGHSVGSSLVILDKKYVFSGDSILKDYPVIISFPTSNKTEFLNRTLPLFEKTLSPDMTIFPGHGEPFMLSEIMKGGNINVEFR